MTGLREEIALAQYAADEYEAEAAELRRRGKLAEAARARRLYERELEHVRQLEREREATS